MEELGCCEVIEHFHPWWPVTRLPVHAGSTRCSYQVGAKSFTQRGLNRRQGEILLTSLLGKKPLRWICIPTENVTLSAQTSTAGGADVAGELEVFCITLLVELCGINEALHNALGMHVQRCRQKQKKSETSIFASHRHRKPHRSQGTPRTFAKISTEVSMKTCAACERGFFFFVVHSLAMWNTTSTMHFKVNNQNNNCAKIQVPMHCQFTIEFSPYSNDQSFERSQIQNSTGNANWHLQTRIDDISE